MFGVFALAIAAIKQIRGVHKQDTHRGVPLHKHNKHWIGIKVMNILFMGDSLIEYFDWQERFPDHDIANHGYAGESVEGLLSRIGSIKEVSPAADMIFIMTGINNMAMGDAGFIGPYERIIKELSSMYPAARIFINSLISTIVDFIENESIKRMNVLLKDLAEDRGVEYLDIYSLFVDKEGRAFGEYLLDDGVHLSTHGYAVWSNALKNIIDR